MISANKIKASKIQGGKIVSSKIQAQSVATPAPAFCSEMAWTPQVQTNSTGAFSGIRLTITNDGGGAGSYFTKGDTSWTSATGKVSGELTFISSSASTSTHNLYIIQGVTIIAAVSYNEQTKVLTDIVASSNIATALTGASGFTFNVVLNQALGTATCEHSEDAGNPLSLTVSGSYNNALASSWAAGGGTGVSEVTVQDINLGSQAFTLASSDGRFCDYV